jgi:hypothetical protein
MSEISRRIERQFATPCGDLIVGLGIAQRKCLMLGNTKALQGVEQPSHVGRDVLSV